MRASLSLLKPDGGLFSSDNCHTSCAADAYLRAEAIAKVYQLTLQDIAKCSARFWDMHADPILCLDGAATTLLTIQYNLCIGTLAPFVSKRRDLLPIAQSLLKYETIGQFCLTEVGHGLDAFNLGTTATLIPTGGFELHTPSPSNAKFMPPTLPVLGRPCVAIVFAQLIVGSVSLGVRPFLVQLNNGHRMSAGITAQLLPSRHGAARVNHAITTFTHVQLPQTALLGEFNGTVSSHDDFLASIWRVGVGTLALSSIPLSALQIAATIAYQYSIRRKTHTPQGSLIPIISFPTQHLPVLFALAEAYVLDAFHAQAVKLFTDRTLDARVRHGMATIFKAITMHHAQNSHVALSERCGAQGLFGYNQIASHLSEMRGIAIAEGDVLVLSIRLATEVFLGRYSLPPAECATNLLAQHELGLLASARALVQEHGHRSTAVLPRCMPFVRAIGHRMAHDAAVSHGVPGPLVELFIAQAVQEDLAWYVEQQILTTADAERMRTEASMRALPSAAQWVEQMGVGPFVNAPIVEDERWDNFVESLPRYEALSEKTLHEGVVVAKNVNDVPSNSSATWSLVSLIMSSVRRFVWS